LIRLPKCKCDQAPLTCTRMGPIHGGSGEDTFRVNHQYYHAHLVGFLMIFFCVSCVLPAKHLSVLWFYRAFFGLPSSTSITASPQPFICELLHLFSPGASFSLLLSLLAQRLSAGLDIRKIQPALSRFVCGAEMSFRVRTHLE